jgi:hypothetical protein
MRFLGLASVAAVLAIAGVSAASTLRGRGTSETTSEGTVVSDARPAKAVTKAVPQAVAPVIQQSAPAASLPETTKAAEPTPAPSATLNRATTRGGFVLVEGSTQLTDSIYATRAGDSVVVNFDAFGFRTRRPDKIEQSLRLTLPMIFGKMATASIDTTSTGTLVTTRDVVGELARDGMRVKLDNGAIAHIRVLTRIVSDGPIAIGYLTTIER